MNEGKTEPEVGPPTHGVFPATRWSVVINAGAESSTQAQEAFATLCNAYWYPIYSYIRRLGRSHHEAEDSTQSFLAHLMDTEGVARARPERGRFRSFLATALRNHLTNEWQRDQAAKRGGGNTPLPLDFKNAAERFSLEPVDAGLTPEQAFDRNWAVGLIDATIGELREEYEEGGRGALYAALVQLVWGNDPNEPLEIPAKRLGMSTHAFTVALQRLRRRLGERLRSRVAETVENPDDIDAELRHLIAAINNRAGS